ncbi:nectin-3 [Lissotriton helveticus]
MMKREPTATLGRGEAPAVSPQPAFNDSETCKFFLKIHSDSMGHNEDTTDHPQQVPEESVGFEEELSTSFHYVHTGSSLVAMAPLEERADMAYSDHLSTHPAYGPRRVVAHAADSVLPAHLTQSIGPAAQPRHELDEFSGRVAAMAPREELPTYPRRLLVGSRTVTVTCIPMSTKARQAKHPTAHLGRPKRPLSASLLALTLLLWKACGAVAGRIVADPQVTAVWGKNVTLRCIFEANENITQITWEKTNATGPVTVAVNHPEYGSNIPSGRAAFKSQSLHDASLTLYNVQFSDSGQYVCKAATFPLGNAQSTTKVTVIVEPSISLTSGPYPLIDEGNMTVAATCTAAYGKPAAAVRWEGNLGQAEEKTAFSPNHTVTVVSEYKVFPTKFAQGRIITCVVTHPALEKTVRLPYVLDILYAPEVSVTGHDGKWFVGSENLHLRCNADSNPPPTEFTWSRLDGEWPEGLLALNNTLVFSSSLTHNHSGVYVCMVANALGERSGQKSIRILDPPTTPTLEPTLPYLHATTGTRATTLSKIGRAPDSTLDMSFGDNLGTIIGCAVGGSLLVILVIVVAGVTFYRRRQTFRGDYFTKNYIPPSGMQKESRLEDLQTGNLDPYAATSTKDQHPMNNLILSEHMGSIQKPNWNSVDAYNRYQERIERPLDYYEGMKTPMATDPYHEDSYEDEDFVSHVDGSVISRKEWYV